MNKKLLTAGLLILFLSGCATQSGMYNWGSYEQDLFNYYHEPALKEEIVTDHATFITEVYEGDGTPAPGLLSEAGTYYLLEGDISSALKFYRLEYEVWPESRPMMGALIENLEDN